MSTKTRPKRPARALLAILQAAALLSTLPLPARAEAVRHELDPVHTRVLVAISHAGFSDALGTVSGSTGELWFDPDDWRSARLSASIPIARLDLGDEQWNRAALAANLLDAGKHPVARFTSTGIEPVDDTHARVHGLLTLRGVEREIVLDVTLNAAKRYPMPPFRRTVGFSATTTLSRKAFGMDAWPTVIGDAVEVRIEAEAVRRRGDDDPPPPATDVPAEQPTRPPALPEQDTGDDPERADPEAEPPAGAPTPVAPEPATEPEHDATPCA